MPFEAAFREAYEESGLSDLELVRYLATDTVYFANDPTNHQIQERHFFIFRPAYQYRNAGITK